MLDLSEIQTIEHDVIVIGAGGAGLRAAIECSRQGLDTGIVCKSLLGKAHTVMAEGGAAAALGNMTVTTGRSTSGTRCVGANSSISGGWLNCTLSKRQIGFANSRSGVPSSTGPKPARLANETSAAIAMRDSHTWATGLDLS